MSEPFGRVAVFWHYDSLPPPSIGGSPGAISRATQDATFNIRRALQKFGTITCFRAYVGSMPTQAKWELQSHGVTVVECLSNASETMITADMVSYPLDNPSLGVTFVLISSSSSLAYTVSVLRARRYRVALISIPGPHNNTLLAEASEVIDWLCLRSSCNAIYLRPVVSPVAQSSSDGSSPVHPTGIEYNPHTGFLGFPNNRVGALEHSFTMNDLNSREQPGSPLVNPIAAQLERLALVDGRPPSYQLEEEDAEESSGPRSFDSTGRPISLLNKPLNRSASEPTLGGNPKAVRPRANSLQDDRRPNSLSRKLTLTDHILMRSLPTPRTTPPSLWGLESGKSWNIGASPFIPSLGMTPPSEPSETTILPPIGPAGGTRQPFFRFERRGSDSPTSSTAEPVVAPAPLAMESGLSTQPRFTQAERRAVETVINVLLEMRSRGKAPVSSRSLPHLILARDRMIYKGVGSRGNRFWKLINLGVQMGWLEAGPETAWIDVGKGWSGENGW